MLNNNAFVTTTSTNSAISVVASGTKLSAGSGGTTSGGEIDRTLGTLTNGLRCAKCRGKREGLGNGLEVTRKLASDDTNLGARTLDFGESKRKCFSCAPTGPSGPRVRAKSCRASVVDDAEDTLASSVLM